jgi:hypothetical protein
VTWQQALAANDPSGQIFSNLGYPCAPKTGGRIYITYLTFEDEGINLRLTSSDDGGATWIPLDQALTVNVPNDAVAFDDPTCAAEGNEVWVSYGHTAEATGTFESDRSDIIRLAHSSDGGASIDQRFDVQDSQAAKYFIHPQMTREDDGAIDITYYAGQDDLDEGGSFRRARAANPNAGFAPSVAVELPITFLTSRSDPHWLGDYTGLMWRNGQAYMSYVVNTSDFSHVAFAKANAP